MKFLSSKAIVKVCQIRLQIRAVVYEGVRKEGMVNIFHA